MSSGAWTNVNCPVFACDSGAEGQRRNGLLIIPQTDGLARNKILGRFVSFFAIKPRIDVRPDSQPLLVYSSLLSSFMLLRLRSVPSYAEFLEDIFWVIRRTGFQRLLFRLRCKRGSIFRKGLHEERETVNQTQ